VIIIKIFLIKLNNLISIIKMENWIAVFTDQDSPNEFTENNEDEINW
jgi:hypothetical protein